MAASLLFRSRSGGALHFSCRRYSRSGWEESGQIPAFPPGHSATPPAIRRAEEVEAEGGISRTFPPTTSRRRSEIAVTSSAAGIAPTFWSHEVQYVVPSELSRSYAFDRAVDKRSRFVVRSRLREDGAVSNLYPIYFPQEVAEGSNNGGGGGGGGGRTSATKAPLYVYEMYVTRVVRDATTTGTGGRGLVASDDITRTGASARKGKSGCGSRRSAEGEGYVSMTTGTEKVVEKRVEPRRAWKAIRRFLQRRFGSSLPPVVQLEQRVYATGPLPDEALKVPAEYHDLGWHKCELRTVSHCVYTQLSAPQMQELTNAIVMWSIWGKEQLQGYAVAHKNKRKLVCTEAGVSSNGLRVYRGTIVDAIFVDDSDAAAYDGFTCTSGSTSSGQTATASATSPSLSLSPPPSTRTLGEAKAGVLTGAEPVFFRIESFIRSFVYGKRPVESYKIADASGAFLASLWDPPVGHLPLQSGDVFAAPASTVRIHVFPERGNMRLVEMRIAEVRPATEEELHTLGVKPRAAAEKARNSRKGQKAAMDNSKPTSSSSSQQQQQQPLTGFPGRLSLKIDTKGTIASEMSMWDEVKQHFGPGPYSEEEQRRITRAVQGTPVVISYSLRQSIVRLVRFYDSSTGTISIARHADGEDAREEGDSNDRVGEAHSVRASSRNELTVPAVRTEHSETGVFSHRMMDPGLVPHIPELEVNQPIAVLPDYTMVPLQALHCCFDPRMKGWQETAIAVLSLMPEKRAKVLEQFRGKLSEGLAQWGLTLATEPLRSKCISLLPAPQKSFNTPMNYLAASQGRHLRHPAPVSFPTTILVVGVAGTRRTSEERNRIALTAQNVAQSFKTSLVACVTEEKEAVAFMAQQVLIPAAAGASSQQQQLRDANVALLLITSEKESRATRWVTAECLSRGVLPIVVSPVSSPSRVNLLSSSIKRQISTKFESNPLRGIDLCREVPVLRGKRLLSVGVDTCHTSTQSVGSVVCLLSVPERNHVLSIFWRQEARGQEAQLVSAHFKILLTKAAAMYDGLDEVVVFQDGDLFSELNSMSDELAACVPGCGMTFMCLHKRTNIRLFHEAPKSGYAGAGGGGGGADIPVRNNIVKGALMPALTPVVLDYEEDASSFYLQTHDSNMSTARTVHYTVHRTSPTLELGDIQQISNVMANVLSPQSTKLPMPTRCAHKLADKAERLLDAVPQLRCDMIPPPLSERLWFM